MFMQNSVALKGSYTLLQDLKYYFILVSTRGMCGCKLSFGTGSMSTIEWFNY